MEPGNHSVDQGLPRPSLLSTLQQSCFLQCCCQEGCSTVSGNKILPVTTAPPQFDFLEIRPNRRIRVLHLHPKKQRLGATLSRAAVFEEGDGGRRHHQENCDDVDSDEDEESYWFENASPKRMPIQPPAAPLASSSTRIFNKFEPQEPPRIAGIKPPRASLAKNGFPQSSPVAGGGQQKLQRKKIIVPPSEQPEVDDDEENCVSDPGISLDVGDGHDEYQVDNVVANVLADMSEMVISITAESTECRRNGSPASTPPQSHSETSSPKLNERRVVTQPDPAENDPVEVTTVVVDGGHLGGMANVGFVGEEDKGSNERISDDCSTAEEDDSADVGYTRNRDLSDTVTKASLPENGESIPCNQTPPEVSSPSLPVLFFLHGVGGSADTWSSQVEFFTALGYEVIVPDLLGHGFSSSPDDARCYSFAKLFRDALTIFDHYVGEGRSCALIAHSYGCSFAAALARTRPNSVIMLLLLACGGPTPLAPPPSTTGPSLHSTLLVTCLKPFLKFRRRQQYNPKGKAMKFQAALDVPSYVIRHICAGQDWPEGDATFHRRIPVPTLLVYGLKDPFVSLVEMCEMERTIPRSYLELIPLAGHSPMVDAPKELNAMLKRFIEKYQWQGNQ